MKNGHAVRNILLVLSFILFAAALYLVFIYAPTEATMGIVQKIFYLMVPVAWLALLSFIIIFISSILYLRKKAHKWDIISSSAAELGLLFTTLTLITGSLWAKPIWGVWWSWEPRLTATLVLWLIYIVYFMVRSFATEESRGATFAAVVGIVGFVDVPIIGMATSLWRGMHPPMLIFEGGISTSMLVTLLVSIAAYTVLYFAILSKRIPMKNAEIEIKRIEEVQR